MNEDKSIDWKAMIDTMLDESVVSLKDVETLFYKK